MVHSHERLRRNMKAERVFCLAKENKEPCNTRGLERHHGHQTAMKSKEYLVSAGNQIPYSHRTINRLISAISHGVILLRDAKSGNIRGSGSQIKRCRVWTGLGDATYTHVNDWAPMVSSSFLIQADGVSCSHLLSPCPLPLRPRMWEAGLCSARRRAKGTPQGYQKGTRGCQLSPYEAVVLSRGCRLSQDPGPRAHGDDQMCRRPQTQASRGYTRHAGVLQRGWGWGWGNPQETSIE